MLNHVSPWFALLAQRASERLAKILYWHRTAPLLRSLSVTFRPNVQSYSRRANIDDVYGKGYKVELLLVALPKFTVDRILFVPSRGS
jgi:hypothetical protein